MSSRDRLEYLQASRADGCARCDLHKGRNRLVFGVGDPEAAIVVVGEGPGEDENREGEPFVGPAGQLLDGLFRRVGIARADLYILNMVKCFPGDPTDDDLAACAPLLHTQLAIIQPRVILAVGGVAARYLTGEDADARVGYLRKHDWMYKNSVTGLKVPLIVTYHPSYILRSRDDQQTAKATARKIVADLGKVLRLTEGV